MSVRLPDEARSPGEDWPMSLRSPYRSLSTATQLMLCVAFIVATLAYDSLLKRQGEPLKSGTRAGHRYAGVASHVARGAADDCIIGFPSTLTACCEHDGIPHSGVPVGTIKKHATGKGNADKAAMVAAMRTLGFDPADDNEADALALLGWACAHDPPASHQFGPQRDERPAAAPTHHQ